MMRLLLQKQPDLGPHCLYRTFWRATSVRNFRAFTVNVLAIPAKIFLHLTIGFIGYLKQVSYIHVSILQKLAMPNGGHIFDRFLIP